MANQILLTPQRALDENANAEPGAKAYFYEAGTSTPMTVYTDSTLATAHPSPLVADSEGNFAQVFFSGATGAKVDIYDANDVQMTGYPIDNMPTIGTGTSAASGVSFTPTAGNAATDVQAAIENSLSAANNLSDLGNAATSRSNLGAAAASHSHTAGDLPSATTTGAGIVEKSTSAENVAGTASDVYPDVVGVKEMVDTHAAGGFSSVQAFTASGTWTRPSGVTKVLIFVTGGGQAGDTSPAATGASGGTAIKFLDVSAIASSTITIGTAGTSNSASGSSSTWADGTNTITGKGGGSADTTNGDLSADSVAGVSASGSGMASFWGDSFGRGGGSTSAAGQDGVIFVMEFK